MGKRARARRIGRGIGERLTYANVMATIAVFGVLAGGGAYAASKLGSKDIKKNAVRSKHIKAANVKNSDIAGNAVNSAKVAGNSLTHRDINQATRELMPVAVVLIGGNGAVAGEAHRAPITGPPMVDHPTPGIYELSFPGLSLGGNDLPLCTYRGLGDAGEITAFTGGAGILTVHVRDSNGVGEANSFQCAVYDL